MSTKKFVRYVLLLIILLPDYKIFAQCPSTLATTTDLVALPTNNLGGAPQCPAFPYVSGAANTGTDVYYDGNNDCQVMVFDGTNAAFSWRYGANTGSILFNSMVPGVTMVDPDVVVQVSPLGGVYAVLVAQVNTGTNAGKIYWACFKWATTTFGTAPVSSGYLGDLTNGVCLNPNIDVNSCGRVAIAWGQRTTYNITIQTTGAPAGLNFGPITLNIARGDIFIAQGFIDGRGCTGAGTIAGNTVALGDRATIPAFPMGVDHLFEVNMSPDICISEGKGGSCSSTEFVITIAYINQWFDPSQFAIKSQVIANQFKGLTCVGVPGSTGLFQLNSGNYAGKPRIAARPDNSATNFGDFQIVMADASAPCNPLGPPCSPWNTKIYNWGRHNGAGPVSTPSILTTAPINGCDLTPYYNNEAVVAYRNPALAAVTNGDYVVAWTNGGFVTGGIGWDVVAKTYNQGFANLASPGSTKLSIVNNGCSGVTGNQYLPSIAGRYSKQIAYTLYDVAIAAHPYIAYKISGAQPGSINPLRQVLNTGINAGLAPQTESESFTVQPNPFTDEISFRINLDEGNKASQIEITDASGRLVKTLQVSDNMKSISWKPSTGTGAGIYHAKLYTTHGPMVTQIIKAN